MLHTVQPGDTLFRISRKYDVSTETLLELNGLSETDMLRIGQVLQVSKQQDHSDLTATDHIVQRGDSLYAISRKYGTTPAAILDLNGMAEDATIYAGQVLKVKERPSEKISSKSFIEAEVKEEEIYTVQKGDSLYAISRRFNTTPNTILLLNGLSPRSPIYIGQKLRVREAKDALKPTAKTGKYYIVQRGDSLYSIALKYGTTPEKILALNEMERGATIYAGQRLMVGDEHTVIRTSVDLSSYTVQRGDTILSIARQFGLTPSKLFELNGFRSTQNIYVGQKLRLKENIAPLNPRTQRPDELPNYHLVGRGESISSIAAIYKVSPARLLRENNLPLDTTIFIGQKLKIPSAEENITVHGPSPVQTGNYAIYTVQSGDWLDKIAKQFDVTAEEIMEANDLPHNRLSIGQTLRIPTNSTKEIPREYRHLAKKITRARRLFRFRVVNGMSLFGSGLKGSISRGSRIHPEDLSKLQERLVQLEILSENHNESPGEIKRRNRGGDIFGTNIPTTLAALLRFQERYKVDYWNKTDARIAMMGTSNFTRGAVYPNDLTYKHLRELTHYTIAFPHPEQSREMVIADFRDFAVSSFNQFYKGVSFNGDVNPDLPIEMFTNLGLDASLALAMKYVSKHEGNFDAINTYDKAIFSYGFIQFAGNGGGLGAVIGTMKRRFPREFEEFFQQFGIDVDYQLRNGEVHRGDLIVYDINGSGAFKKKGVEAEMALRADVELYGAFIRAAYNLNLVSCQIEHAIKGYVKFALGIKLDLNTGRYQVDDVPITEIIRSPKGLALAIDLTVNQWISKTRQYFEQAINEVARTNGLHSLAALKTIDERAVIRRIIANAGSDTRVIKRGTSILEGTLAATKSREGTQFIA